MANDKIIRTETNKRLIAPIRPYRKEFVHERYRYLFG
mgnify:CR=1 FL=1